MYPERQTKYQHRMDALHDMTHEAQHTCEQAEMSGVYRSWCQPREVLRRCRLSTCTPCASSPSTAGASSFAAAAQIESLSGSYL